MENKQPLGQMELLILMFFGFFLLDKIFQKIILWLRNPNHYWMLMGGIALVVILLLIFLWPKIMAIRNKNIVERKILEKTDDSVFCGVTSDKKDVWIKPNQRSMHTQIVGTTNAGKTESVILPWAIQDIHAGKGLLLIDGKADNTLLDKLWSYTVLAKRESDFRLVSFSHIEKSHSFNPLVGGSAEEITERVFNSFEFENPYYRSLQYEVMGQVMRIFELSKITPTFQKLHTAISRPLELEKMVSTTEDLELKTWVEVYKNLSNSERDTRTSGLLAAISHFSYGKTATIFNADEHSFTIDEALNKNLIVYFQLPVLLSPFLGKATGKLVLQSLQAGVANRHRSFSDEKNFFSVFLDDFSEYLYPGFTSILNKSRSANVGIVFAHQALGDITALGDSVANTIMTNSNLKIFMRGNDPTSAEYFSKLIGTKAATKYTERGKRSMLSNQRTGDVSVREVEEFVVHPNDFKSGLGVGEAMMVVPHPQGTKTVKIKFHMLDDLPRVALPNIEKKQIANLSNSEGQENFETINAVSFGSLAFKSQKESHEEI